MSEKALKWITILWFAIGGTALVVAVLIGPDFFPLGDSKQHQVYLDQPFKLVDQNGRAVTERDFQSKPTAWFFGFTNCPDVCPTTLADLSQVLDRLGPDADKLNVVFVTVDPERDTPEVLREYVASFDPRIVGLTGSPEEIAATAKEHFVHQAKVPLKDGSYTMEHTSKVLLTAADGRFVGTIDHHDPVESQVEKLRALTHEG